MDLMKIHSKGLFILTKGPFIYHHVPSFRKWVGHTGELIQHHLCRRGGYPA
jgi:hypothetical protein